MIDLQPLYLDGGSQASVMLDGPALRVESAGRCAGRYPLRRLSRVVVGGKVEWQTAAILACMKAGIVLTFTDAKGAFSGLCIGPPNPHRGRALRLEEFNARLDWQEHYVNWHSAMQRRALLKLVNRIGISRVDLRADVVHRLYFNKVTEFAEASRVNRVLGYMYAAVACWGGWVIRDCGIPPTLLMDDSKNIALVRDLGHLLGWEARFFAYRLLAQADIDGVNEKVIIANNVEDKAGRLVKTAQEYLRYLDQVCLDLENEAS